MKILFFLAATIAILGAFEIEGGYEISPSAQTYGNAPVISDELMKECVKIYNKALAIERTLNPNLVNREDFPSKAAGIKENFWII